MTTSEGSGIDILEKEAAPLNTRARTRPSAHGVAAWILRQIQAQADRWPLWTPVAFGCGCGAYFALKSEPDLSLVAGAAGLFILAAIVLRRWSRAPVLAGLVLLAAFATAKQGRKAQRGQTDFRQNEQNGQNDQAKAGRLPTIA